jgi:hypothetical protein
VLKKERDTLDAKQNPTVITSVPKTIALVTYHIAVKQGFDNDTLGIPLALYKLLGAVHGTTYTVYPYSIRIPTCPMQNYTA